MTATTRPTPVAAKPPASRQPDYRRMVWRKRGYGTWQPYVDAEPVRQHLHMLREHGIGFERAAVLAGLYSATVGAILYDFGGQPRRKRVRPETAAAILAIQPSPALLAEGQMIDGTGSRWRLQALAAIGWPFQRLGEHLPVHPAQVGRIARARLVQVRTARGVADAYLTLRHEDPASHGVIPGTLLKTRRMAAKYGWHDPLFWDDMGRIDDPTFDPAAAEAPLKKGELGALRREEIRHLASFGIPEGQIATRLDMAAGSVRDILTELRTGRTRDRRKTEAA